MCLSSLVVVGIWEVSVVEASEFFIILDCWGFGGGGGECICVAIADLWLG